MIIKIIIIPIIVILLLHYKNYSIKNDDIEIIQINEFDKNIYEKSLKLKQPIVLYDFLNNLVSFNLLSFDSLKDLDNMSILISDKEVNIKEFVENIESNNILELDYVYIEDNKILTYLDLPLNDELKLLTSPLSIHKSKNLSIIHKDYISPLVYTTFERNFYLNYEGEVEFYIYKPKDIDNLYFKKKNQIYYESDVENILNKEKNELEYPNIYQSNYITIKLYKGQALILPNHYPYCYKVNESTLLINSKSDTIFSFVYNLKNILV